MRTLIWSLIGVFVVLSSFFVTLFVLDYRDRVQSFGAQGAAGNVPAEQAQSTTAKNVIFNLSISDSNPNWRVANDQTAAHVIPEGLAVTSRVPVSQNELTTDTIVTASRRNYLVQFDIAVTQGSTALGVLDVSHQKWITVYHVDRRDDSFRFTASTDAIVLVIVNASPGANALTVRKLALALE